MVEKIKELRELMAASGDYRAADNDKDMAKRFYESACSVISQHSDRLQDVREATVMYDSRMYKNLLGSKLQDIGYTAYDNYSNTISDTDLHINLIQSTVDTLVSKIGKHAILPRIVTSGAQWHVRDNAKKADRWVRGMMRKLNVNEKTVKALLHSCLYGYGFVKVCIDNGELDLVNVHPDEVFVDLGDSHYGNPTTMYHVAAINRTVLQASYPELAGELENVQNLSDNFGRTHRSRDTDTILVVEGWSLPQGDLKGSHLIVCGDIILFKEEWDRDYFPIIKMDYNPPVMGYYPRGLAHSLYSIQKEYDDVINRMSEAQHLISAPKIILQDGSGIEEEFISNDIGTILRVRDLNDIKVIVPQSISGDTFAYADRLKASAFELSGVSMMSAASRMPAGIDGASGRALREYSNIETERFAFLAKSWEMFHKKIGETLIKELKHCEEDYRITVVSKNKPNSYIAFSDLDLDIDDIVVQIFSVSALPASPTARLQLGEELVQGGVVNQEEAADLLGLPDIDALLDDKQAPRRAVERLVDRIMNDAKYDPFEDIDQFLDLQYLREKALLKYNVVLADFDQEGEDVTEMKRKLKEVLITVDQMLTPQQSAMPPAETAAMGGAPEMGGVAPLPQDNPLAGMLGG